MRADLLAGVHELDVKPDQGHQKPAEIHCYSFEDQEKICIKRKSGDNRAAKCYLHNHVLMRSRLSARLEALENCSITGRCAPESHLFLRDSCGYGGKLYETRTMVHWRENRNSPLTNV